MHNRSCGHSWTDYRIRTGPYSCAGTAIGERRKPWWEPRRGAWVRVQAQAERECEEAHRTDFQQRGLGGCGARMAGERGRVAVDWMDQGAAGGGVAAAVAEQTGGRSRNCA